MMIAAGKYEIDPDRFYDAKEHFWLSVDKNGIARIGMDPLLQESTGALVVVQLVKAGKRLKRGDSFGTIEAEKYVGPLRSPVSGTVRRLNDRVVQTPRLAHTDPYGQGWLIELELNDFEEEKKNLLTGKETLKKWFEEEIRKHQEEGWLAES